MRRSFLAGIGALAVFIFAACTDRPLQDSPLVPTEPSLAVAGACGGSDASNFSKAQKVLFTTALATMEAKFKVIKANCTNTAAAVPLMMEYIQLVIVNREQPDK